MALPVLYFPENDANVPSISGLNLFLLACIALVAGLATSRLLHCSGRKNIIRSVTFVWGFVIAEIIIRSLPFDESWKTILAFSIGFFALLFTEVIVGVGFLEYLIFHNRFLMKPHFDKSSILRSFIEKHDEFGPISRARIILNSFLANEDDKIELKLPFREYLYLLSAATKIAQEKWYATYHLPLNKWKEISDASGDYFMALKSATIKKTRYAILKQEEINAITQTGGQIKEHEIVGDTLGVNGELYLILGSDAEIKKDFAVFDDYLVITQDDGDDNSHDGDDNSRGDYLNKLIKVSLIKGREKSNFSWQIERLQTRIDRHTVHGHKVKVGVNGEISYPSLERMQNEEAASPSSDKRRGAATRTSLLRRIISYFMKNK